MYKPIGIVLLLFLNVSACNSPSTTTSQATTAFEDPPNWASEVVWYQIFVERFRNGDSTNDPTPADMEGAYPGFVPDNWELTPWTQDWYAEDSYWDDLEGFDFYGNPLTEFGQKSQLRRYGGDLQGVLDQIDYLDSLGITAVYFNPLNEAPSLHKYDARHWRHIDRNFGPDPKGDITLMQQEVPDDPSTWVFTSADDQFIEVIAALHERGIRVILDYSWNHTGIEFWAWKDVIEKQAESKFNDWYWVKQFDDPNTDENEFEYRGWLGVHSLPEIRETVYVEHDEKVTPVEGNVYSEAMKQHIFSVAKRWLDPNQDGDPSDGVDGYRLDVAAEMPYGFWRDFRKVVREVNPDAYLLGEVWWEQWPDKLLHPGPFLKGDIFDAPMNYRWYRSARQFFNASPIPHGITDFVDSLQNLRKGIRDVNQYAMMNLTASHDAPRVLTSLYNKNLYKLDAHPSKEDTYKLNKPDEDTHQTLRLLLAHQFTYIGAPHIWAGDEMGMWGTDDPSCRKPLIWPDYEFEDEKAHPYGNARSVDQVLFNQSLFDYYRQLIAIRNSNPVLTNGDIEFVLADNENEWLAYRRFNRDAEILAVFNCSRSTSQVLIEDVSTINYENLLGDEKASIDNSRLSITLPARSAAILVATR